MYLGHLRVMRRSLYAEIGGCRAGFDGAQDHDLALRAAEHAREVVHVPLVLYHWRAWRGSVADSGNAKPAGFDAARNAIEQALARRAVPAPVERPAWARRRAIGIYTPRFPDDGPEVAVLIPTRNRADLLRPCLHALARTAYRRHRVVVVDNGSDDAEALRLLEGLPNVLPVPSPGGRFSFAAVMNRAAAGVDAELLLFLNDDTEALAPEWLSQMVGYSRLPGVGAVGAKLVRPDDRLDHAGIVHGADGGLPGHAFRGREQSDSGYMALADVARNCSGVTAACLLTPRALFLEHGGFDERYFAVAYNDVDYCDRLRASGHRIVYCPSAVVRHRVGASRGPRDDPNERREMRRRRPVPRDRYVNPNLALEGGGFDVVPRRLVRGPRPRLSVLSWGTDLTLTGAPLHQLELLKALRDRGRADVRVTVVRDGPLRKAFSDAGLAVEVRCHPLADVGPTGYDAAVSRLAEELSGGGADVVHVNTLEAFYAVDAAARAGRPCVWNVHEVYQGPQSGCWPPGFEGRGEACFRKPYRTVFVSEAARASFSPLDRARRGAVVRNVLDPRRVRRATPSDRACARARLGVTREIVVLLLGTVCERKGQHDLVEALGRLSPSLADRARFVIVGERGLPYGLDLRRRAEALPAALRAILRIEPEVLDPTPFLQAADLFLCTSRIESYPRVVLEAMAHGLPIVTTPVYGIVEQVREGVNAFFYPPGDTEALASILGDLIEDESERRRLAAAAEPTLESLGTFDAMVDAYAEVLAEAWLAGPLS
jgi:GT2 family glycosyltransferase/glycosyltransferase involved in cell wall biosynthesis